MIEQIIFLMVGFFVASLLGLAIMPFVHNRALRLTMKRLEAATPLSLSEIQADKDKLRAEFAMSTRRLELAIERMKVGFTSQVADLGKKSDAINRLKAQLHEKTAVVFSLASRERALADQIGTMDSELSVKTAALRKAELTLQEKQTELAKVATDLTERSAGVHSQRIEDTALRVQMEALKDRISGHKRDANELNHQMIRAEKETIAVAAELQEERRKAEKLGDRVAELERRLVAQTTEAEILGRRVQEAEVKTTHQAKLLSEREIDITELRAKMVEIRKADTDLRADIAAGLGRRKAATDALIKETSLVEGQFSKAKAECAKLQQEIASLKCEAEDKVAAGRMENELLRECINDIAAELARLSIALEGPGSPIEAILAGKTPLLDGEAGTMNDQHKNNLAARIRALQNVSDA